MGRVGAKADKHSWVVHKFGGTRVAAAECFRRVMGEHIGLEELNAAFDRLASGQTVRQILIP